MDIQGTTAHNAEKVKAIYNKPNNRFMKLILQPAKWLKCLLRGVQIATALSLASVATAQSNLVMDGSSVYADLGKDQFAAALYLETLQQNPSIAHSMQGEKHMEVRVLNNYSKRRWFNLWMQSISINIRR
jgi:protein TonB